MSPKDLPIWQLHDLIVGHLRFENRLVLVAPTGSGKTTQVPQMLLDAGLAGDKNIFVLQPRRVAARTVAARVAWERRVRLGGEVGYQVRFDDQTSLGTRISFITEGILLRRLQDDPALNNTAILLFDEFHERNLLSDVALALARRLQQTSRPDLRIAVMSATLDANPVADYLGGCDVLVSEGQSFPVSVRYLEHHDDRTPAEQAAGKVAEIVNSGSPGDILVFMPGMGEINATIGAIRAARPSERLAVIPLHGELQPADQDLAFAPNALRKVVVATNVAETSITIDGIRHVVDSGFARVARYDAERGIGTLCLEPISRASAEQRRGRAGRTAPGTCYRLWTESGHLNRPERNTPEIQRSDLAEVVLLLHSLGIQKAAEFEWLDRPDPQAVERAEKLLIMLGALAPVAERSDASVRSQKTQSDLTAAGREMLRLPMHPRYARMLVEARQRGCVRPAALCAALVSGRDLLVRLRREDASVAKARELFEESQESDFFKLIRAYEYARSANFAVEACRRYGINAQVAQQVEQTFQQILTLAERNLPGAAPSDAAAPILTQTTEEGLMQCLTAGFVDQLCVRQNLGTLECNLTEGRQGTLMRESIVQKATLLVAAAIREVPGRGGENLTLLGLATAVKPEWLQEMFPQHMSARVEHLYDQTHKRVAPIRLIRFADLVIAREHQREVEPEAAGRALAEAARQKLFELPLLNHEVKQLMARVNLVCAAMPELEFPQFDEGAVLGHLAVAFRGLTLAKQAQATPLGDQFRRHLAPEQLAWLDELAPVTLPWPDGRKLKLLYQESASDEDGQPNGPEVQVKLHECFSLKEHPHICEGRVPVKLWLATPDGKRIEPTYNWPGWKANTYPRHKAALQRKFPGTMWV